MGIVKSDVKYVGKEDNILLIKS